MRTTFAWVRESWQDFMDDLDDLPQWGKYTVTFAVGGIFILLATGCATKPVDDTVTVYDLPAGQAIALGGCDTPEKTAAMVALAQKSKPSDEATGCTAFPQAVPIEPAKCEALHGVYRDWEGDPFVTCDVGRGASLIVWIFAPPAAVAPGRGV